MSDDTVWYASYGSNLSRSRFLHYLRGGELPGQPVGHHGARDPSDPIADTVVESTHQLRFAGSSRRWDGGGVAFVDPTPGSGKSLLRAWHVTTEQFSDIAAQENGLVPGELEVDVEAIIATGWADVTDRWYGRFIHLGDVDGRPVVTFSTRENRSPAAPSASYARVVVRGLVEMGSSPTAAAEYLLDAPGVAGHWTVDALSSLADG